MAAAISKTDIETPRITIPKPIKFLITTNARRSSTPVVLLAVRKCSAYPQIMPTIGSTIAIAIIEKTESMRNCSTWLSPQLSVFIKTDVSQPCKMKTRAIGATTTSGGNNNRVSVGKGELVNKGQRGVCPKMRNIAEIHKATICNTIETIISFLMGINS